MSSFGAFAVSPQCLPNVLPNCLSATVLSVTALSAPVDPLQAMDDDFAWHPTMVGWRWMTNCNKIDFLLRGANPSFPRAPSVLFLLVQLASLGHAILEIYVSAKS